VIADTTMRAEEQLVGLALSSHDTRTVDHLLATVPPEAFYRGAHRQVWDAIAAVRDAGDHVGLPTVVDELDRTGGLEAVGGMPWLLGLTADVATDATAEHDAALVMELWRRRQLQQAGHNLQMLSQDRSVDCDTITGKIVEELLATTGRTGDGIIRIDDVADAVMDRRERGIITRGVTTGWPDLDRLYRVVPGGLTILAGIPGHGKSTWLDALLVNLAERHGWRTILFSPESAPTEEHADNLVTARVGRRASLTEVSGALGWVHEHFSWVDHDTHSNVSQILTAVRTEHARRPLNSFVIDPWTEVDVNRRPGEREDEYIRREVTLIRQFARRHNLHAFLVVHPKTMEPNRDGTMPIPRPHDLHGGSVWRKQADALVVVWRDEAGVSQPPELTEVVVQKIRKQPGDGQLGRTTLRFDVAMNAYQQVMRAS
jgi:replicative DNA helicase